ncbi:hypothetical protein [Pontibacter vulgaris]|uniref:hypothetical protein n=1 Tax=Pontibacter vulgaris TaxID=2905679 RepID=UPI001FA7C5F6|nr:hypothetical protein [Pontibacter vulgaris]
MQHYPLWQRLVFGISFQKAALKMVPKYKLRAPEHAGTEPVQTEEQSGFSSPVCYAHLKGMREGFEE